MVPATALPDTCHELGLEARAADGAEGRGAGDGARAADRGGRGPRGRQTLLEAVVVQPQRLGGPIDSVHTGKLGSLMPELL